MFVLTGTRSGYFRRILSPSARRFSNGHSSLYWNFIFTWFACFFFPAVKFQSKISQVLRLVFLFLYSLSVFSSPRKYTLQHQIEKFRLKLNFFFLLFFPLFSYGLQCKMKYSRNSFEIFSTFDVVDLLFWICLCIYLDFC